MERAKICTLNTVPSHSAVSFSTSLVGVDVPDAEADADADADGDTDDDNRPCDGGEPTLN